jgi:hypothetical protein
LCKEEGFVQVCAASLTLWGTRGFLVASGCKEERFVYCRRKDLCKEEGFVQVCAASLTLWGTRGFLVASGCKRKDLCTAGGKICARRKDLCSTAN